MKTENEQKSVMTPGFSIFIVGLGIVTIVSIWACIYGSHLNYDREAAMSPTGWLKLIVALLTVIAVGVAIIANNTYDMTDSVDKIAKQTIKKDDGTGAA